MKEEIWRDIPGYEGLYQASNLGRVRSLDREVKHNYGGVAVKKGKILTPRHERAQVTLNKDGIRSYYLVSRLVYSAFYGPIPEGMQVNHISEDFTDDRLENLNLMTPKENTNWGTRNERVRKTQRNRKDLSKEVIQLNLDGTVIKDDWPSTKEVERVLKYYQANISRCCLGKLKTYKGFIWRYKEKGG